MPTLHALTNDPKNLHIRDISQHPEKRRVNTWLYSLVLLLIANCYYAQPTPLTLPHETKKSPNAPLIQRPRVLVSTDIGGTDPDDFQSLVHLLVYADALELEGLISSPYGPGRKQHILEVIDRYESDYNHLREHSGHYPTPAQLRTLTQQGAIKVAPHAGYRSPTEGSQWIVRTARRHDKRPLHLLVWGGLEDLAQALHDAPDILPKLRVYWIGGPNKKWSPNAYMYLITHHPKLSFIEANATYRGWFVGGDQTETWNNRTFVSSHIAGHGALGDFFARQLGGSIKMGDSPSVGWLLHGTPSDPSLPSWGGRFVRAWKRPIASFRRLTSAKDKITEFGILELSLPAGSVRPRRPEAFLDIENQSLRGFFNERGQIIFRFSPKRAKTYTYTIRSNLSALDGLQGQLTATTTPPDAADQPDPALPNWWTDDPAPERMEGTHMGAKTVSRWRRDFLDGFAQRMDRCLLGQ
ncbi:MAG: DUF1593 domain-containing protein [Myxococcales bacterium]|nr:DUF1593 domain-containing protein [Myxococcales bacterium]